MKHHTSPWTYQDTSQRPYEALYICANLPGHQPATVWSTIHLCKLTRTPASDHIEGFRPEWCISTIYHAWDTPLWSWTLDMKYYTSQPATIWSTIHLCKLTRTPASDHMKYYTSAQTYQDTSQRLYEALYICANLPGHQPATIWSTIHLCKLTCHFWKMVPELKVSTL